ncbi:hypothetical protein [Streptomyces sp. NPDC048669]|uniref:hypothetical protein n=1 Tax=Streptomyces sp. NPDC048669 TaxID=3155267 RepID=UPI003426F9C2
MNQKNIAPIVAPAPTVLVRDEAAAINEAIDQQASAKKRETTALLATPNVRFRPLPMSIRSYSA